MMKVLNWMMIGMTANDANYKQGSADCALEEHVGPASSSSSRALTGFNFLYLWGIVCMIGRDFVHFFYLWGMVGMVGRGFFF